MEERRKTDRSSLSQERVKRLSQVNVAGSTLSVEGSQESQPSLLGQVDERRRPYQSLLVGHLLIKQKGLIDLRHRSLSITESREDCKRFTFSGEPEIIDCGLSTGQNSPSRVVWNGCRSSLGVVDSNPGENSTANVSDPGLFPVPTQPHSRREGSRRVLDHFHYSNFSEQVCTGSNTELMSKGKKLPPPEIQIFQLEEKDMLLNMSQTPSFQTGLSKENSSVLTQNMNSRLSQLEDKIGRIFGRPDFVMRKKRMPTFCSRDFEIEPPNPTQGDQSGPCTFGGPKPFLKTDKDVKISQFQVREERLPLNNSKRRDPLSPLLNQSTASTSQLASKTLKKLQELGHQCTLQLEGKLISQYNTQPAKLNLDPAQVSEPETLRRMIRTLEMSKRSKEADILALSLHVDEIERLVQKAKRDLLLPR